MKDQIGHALKIVMVILFTGMFCFSAYKAVTTILISMQEKKTFDDLVAIVSEHKDTLALEGSDVSKKAHIGSTSSTEEQNSLLDIPLPQYEPLYELNNDFYGWITIEGTSINYPVMYTPMEPEYYLRRDFYGEYSQSGTPFIDGACPVDGSYLLIYGHHMKNKTMFGSLTDYANSSYWQEHPVIHFDTLYEQREYEVVAAFYSRLYGLSETDVFRYYDYKDLSDPLIFEEYMLQVKDAAIYDTGISAEYGDQILVLSTCNYHTDNGRFVVVARRSIQEGT